jgi:hypothetical protein
MVGMAAMMGGTMRSPLTAILFTVELTHDWNVLPALLVGAVMAHGTVLLLRRSILTEKIARRGHHLREAVGRMLARDIGRLPIVDRHDRSRLVGYLGRAGIMRARVRLFEEENLRERGPGAG